MNINHVLLTHFLTGGPTASLIRSRLKESLENTISSVNYKNLENFKNDLIEFINSRTDLHRVDRAQKISKYLLMLHDMGDLVIVREKVAELELMRILSYAKQRDHTAHTLYLFLLGIWLFDNIPRLREKFYEKNMNDVKKSKKFFFQWLYASLLHDVGYVFSDLVKETKDYRNFLDNLFSYDWLKSQLSDDKFIEPQISDLLPVIKKINDEFNKKYAEKLGLETHKTSDPVKILDRLKRIPWMKELSIGYSEKYTKTDTFHLWETKKQGADTDLARFSYTTAKNGIVDHAVASGLLLFQYASYWFWVMKKIKDENNEKINNSIGMVRFSHNLDSLFNDILPACRSVAYHNVDITKDNGKHIQKFSVDEDPLLFLSVLCDELAMWERFPVGEARIINIYENARSSMESNDIELETILDDVNHETVEKAVYRIKNSNFKTNDLIQTLDNKLENWKDFILIKASD